MNTNCYDPAFYSGVALSADASAKIVVPLLLELLRAKTVVDVGCGSGAWLRQFQSHGCMIFGLDGPWVKESQLLIPREMFSRVDLEAGFAWDKKYDLAICLEVAEHLPKSSAETLVASLCKLAPLVFFSAAIPGQGGQNHFNEQWQSYWIERFKTQGFECYDAIRPKIWNQAEVAVHYCQNCLVFARTPLESQLEAKLSDYKIQTHIANLVHPRLLADKTGPANNSFRKFFLQFLPIYFKHTLGLAKREPR